MSVDGRELLGGPDKYYEDESCVIYNADCRDVLDSLTWDAVVTDPPYGVAFKGKTTKWTTRPGGGYASMEDGPEYVHLVVIPIIEALVASGRPVVVTPGRHLMFEYPKPRTSGTIFYPSGAGSGPWGFICSQPIYYYGKDPYLALGKGSRPDSFSTTEAAVKNGHPCPKPIKTMRQLVLKASLPGQTILDPFMGSGTTLRAAKDCGRKSIGIEINERYCEIAAQRMAQEVLAV